MFGYVKGFAVLQNFRLSDPNKDHNSYILLYQFQHLFETNTDSMHHDFPYDKHQYVLGELMIQVQFYKEAKE